MCLYEWVSFAGYLWKLEYWTLFRVWQGNIKCPRKLECMHITIISSLTIELQGRKNRTKQFSIRVGLELATLDWLVQFSTNQVHSVPINFLYLDWDVKHWTGNREFADFEARPCWEFFRHISSILVILIKFLYLQLIMPNMYESAQTRNNLQLSTRIHIVTRTNNNILKMSRNSV